jgi:type IV fimbrial biogenesis protein FimT
MKRRHTGFTLMELMFTILIASILLGLGVPTFREFSRSNSVAAAQNELVTALSLARSEALRRNRPVSVCSSTDGSSCGDETEWGSGWIAFIDRGTPGEVDGDDEVLQVWQPADSHLTLTADSTAFAQFLPTGMSAESGTIEIGWTGCTGKRMRRVTIALSGSLTGEQVDCP